MSHTCSWLWSKSSLDLGRGPHLAASDMMLPGAEFQFRQAAQFSRWAPREILMRSRILRTMAIAAALSVAAEAATIVLFTKAITLKSGVGFSSAAHPEPLHGIQVLMDLLVHPGFGASVMLPQVALYFVFTWTAALLGSSTWTSGIRPDAVENP